MTEEFGSGTQRFLVSYPTSERFPDTANPKDLATQIYKAFVETQPTESATVKEESQPEASVMTSAIRETVASEPGDRAPNLADSHRALQLPTLPSSLAPLSEASIEDDGYRNPAVVPSHSSKLTDEEQSLLEETLRGKLPKSELLRLIRQMETLDDAKIPHRQPLPQRTVNRYRLGTAIGLLILLGVGSSVLMNRPQGKGLVLPNAPSTVPTATPSVSSTAKPDATATPPPPLDATVASRNHLLDLSLKEADKQQAAIDAARQDYLLSLADRQMKKDGTPLQVSLIRRLNAQVLELRRVVGRGGELSGTAQQIAIARSLVGDAKATLLAIQSVWADPGAAPNRHRISPALLTKNLMELAELARIVRESEFEQQLRDTEQRRKEDRNNATLPTP
ncbi:hypothetical protein ACKFKF_15275 [Phormidesmis sp. 146-12]